MLSLRVVGMAEVAKTLKTLDNDLIKQARKDLRSGAQPVANAVKANIPSEAPLRGMIHNGRTAWKPSGVKVAVKTNFSKKAERKGFALVSIVAGAAGKNATGGASFQIADIAGRKNKGSTRSGRAMIRKLNSQGRASRYVYPAAERELPQIEKTLRDTIKKLGRDYTNRLKG